VKRMDSRRLRSTRGSTPSFVKPLLNTLSSMRDQERQRPDQLNALAERLLWDRFGAENGVAETAYAHASVDLLAEHTRYMDGFGLHLAVQNGCSVSVRLAEGTGHRACAAEGPDRDQLEAMALATIRFLAPEPDGGKFVEASVVSSVPPYLIGNVAAPIAVAAARALGALLSSTVPPARQLVGLPTGDPDGYACTSRILASAQTELAAFVLTDARNLESIPLEVPALERPGLALAWLKADVPAEGRAERMAMMNQTVDILRAGSFPELGSMRDIVHKDLDRALSEVPRRFRPLLTYLVTENGRVQKAVAAIQRRDWQMFGALLMMSHASKVSDLKLSHPESDFIVKQVENMSLDGMYGATLLSGDGDAVLMAGQPFSVPPALERLRASFNDRFGQSLSTLLL
jgi:galactokinase